MNNRSLIAVPNVEDFSDQHEDEVFVVFLDCNKYHTSSNYDLLLPRQNREVLLPSF